MKNRLLLIVLLGTITHLHAQLEQDKVLHFGAGALSGAAGAFIASEISDGNRAWTYVGAIGTSLLVGLTKEALDKNNGNEWDNGDLAATVLGGVTVGITIDLFSGKKKKNKRKVY